MAHDVDALRLSFHEALSRSQRIHAPELYCPLPGALHAAAAEVALRSVDWAVAMGLVREARYIARLHRAQIGRLPAHAFPTADAALLQLAADWTMLFCLLDDELERLPTVDALERRLAGLLAVLAGEVAPVAGDAQAEAHAELGGRLRQAGSPPWFARFVAAVRELFFDGFRPEAVARYAPGVPELAHYLEVRAITVGLPVEFVLGELVEGLVLPADAATRSALERLARRACNVVGWANDIFTYEKEMRAGERQNLVVVLMQRDALELDAAVDAAVALHDAEVQAFMAERASLIDAEARRYAAMLAAWMIGHLDWARDTGRYRPASSVMIPVLPEALRSR